MTTNRAIRRSMCSLAAAGALLLGACGDDDSAGPDAGVTVEDLEDLESRVGVLEDRIAGFEDDADFGADDDASDQNDLLGQTVTVSAEVTRVVDDHSFVLSGEGPDLPEFEDFGANIGEGVLVVSTDAPAVSAGDVVQVVGEVRQFTLTGFENDLGIDLDDDLYIRFQQQVALLADQVTLDVPIED